VGVGHLARAATAAVRQSLPAPVRFCRAAMGARGPQRQLLIDAGKGALAATLAWLLADDVLHTKLPWLAPYAAVFIIGTTVHQSVRSAARQVAVVIIGVLLAAGVGVLIPPTLADVPVAVVLGTLIGRWRVLQPDGSWVALTALLLLTYGSATREYTDVSRVYAVALGAAIGVAVNAVIFPPIRLHGAVSTMAARGEDIADLLTEAAEGLVDGADSERIDGWRHRVWQLQHAQGAEDALAEARESLRANPRRLSPHTGTSTAPYEAAATALDGILPQLSSIVTAVAQQDGQWPDGDTARDLRDQLAALLRALSEAVRILGQYPTTPGDGPDSDAGRDALHRATELHQQAKRLCEARPPSTDATAVSAVLMTTQRTLDVVGRPQRATDAD